MDFKCTWDSRNPRASSPGRLSIQPADPIYTQVSSGPKPSLLCLTRDSANHILFTAAKEWTFSMLGSPTNSALEDVLTRGKASTRTWLTRGAIWESLLIAAGHLCPIQECTGAAASFSTALLAARRGKKIIRRKIKAFPYGHHSLTRCNDTNKKLLYLKGSREESIATERSDSAVFQRIPAC